jgi:hypothetical protein
VNAAEICGIERSRLRSLAEPDLELARLLHAVDYQLITPTGTPLSKEQYLGLISSGALRYRAFEPVSEIAVGLVPTTHCFGIRPIYASKKATIQRTSSAGTSTVTNCATATGRPFGRRRRRPGRSNYSSRLRGR